MSTQPLQPAELLARLDALGIAYVLTEHAPVFTVAESAGLHADMPGLHSKNLFLKDKKGRLFLVSANQATRIDLKRLHETLGASGRLSFCSAEALMTHLGVTPGSVTALAVVNDRAGAVTMVLDAALATGEEVNFHPLVNSATVRLARDDLLRFLAATGHPPLIVELPAPPDGQNG